MLQTDIESHGRIVKLVLGLCQVLMDKCAFLPGINGYFTRIILESFDKYSKRSFLILPFQELSQDPGLYDLQVHTTILNVNHDCDRYNDVMMSW